jgi:hypothetical protein
MVRFRREIIFMVGFWWFWDILSTSLTNLVCPKSLTILPIKCLDHHPQLRLMTRQPTHQLSQLIILILQTINIMCCWGSGPAHVRVSGPLCELEVLLVNTTSTRGSEENKH